jgi:hypothetical protein
MHTPGLMLKALLVIAAGAYVLGSAPSASSGPVASFCHYCLQGECPISRPAICDACPNQGDYTCYGEPVGTDFCPGGPNPPDDWVAIVCGDDDM